MGKFIKKCAFFLLAAVPLFSQTENINDREQGLLTNEPFWRQALGGSVIALPDVMVQSAVVALDGGNIRAYSTAGKPMWNYSARGKISPFVTRSREGSSYLSRTNGVFIAVNRVGRELWRRNLGDPLCAKVIPGWDGRLFVPVEKKIFCYTASGNLLWSVTFESAFHLAPVLDRGGGIIFVLENNEVCRVGPFGNIQKWELTSKPVVLLSIGRQQIMALYADGTMQIIGQEETDGVLETLPHLPAAPIAAVSWGNYVAATLNDGRVFFISLDEKKILWSGDSHIREKIKNNGRAETGAEMLFDERGIYVLSRDGASGFTHDGRRLWFTLLQNAAGIPSFGDDGVLYSGGRDWILYAYKIEDRALSNQRSLYGPAPDGSYGTGRFQPSYLPNIPLFEQELKTKLEQVAAGINSGLVGTKELEWTAFLMDISNSNANIQYRINALYLLGRIGSQETVPWLITVFRRENDPAVKSAAAAAIGAIGVDPDGIAIQTFLNSIIHSGYAEGANDEQVLTAMAVATGALCRFSGPPLSDSGLKLLTLLSGSSQPSIVSRQARKEIASLGG